MILQTIGLALIATGWIYILYTAHSKNRKLHKYFFYLYAGGTFLQIVAGGFGSGLSFPAAINLVILVVVFLYYKKVGEDI